MKESAFRFAMALIIIALFVLNLNSIRRMLNPPSPAAVSAPSSPDLHYWDEFKRHLELCNLHYASSKKEFDRCVDAFDLGSNALQLGDCDDDWMKTMSIPKFDQERTIIWHMPGGSHWTLPVKSEITYCGDDRQSISDGGLEFTAPSYLTAEVSFTGEEKSMMWMMGYRPDCLYWSSVDFDPRARLLPNNVWVCDPISR